MKRFLVIGSVVLVVGLIVAGFAIPTLAHGPEGEDTPINQEAWEAMHEACENGDWEAMAEAAEEAHGEDGDHMGGGMMGGNMGGSMMGDGWGGSISRTLGGMMGSW